MSLSQCLISFKNSIRNRTMKVINEVPQDRLNWRPVEGVLSLGQLVHHLGQADMAWTKVLSRDWDFPQFLNARFEMDLLKIIGEVQSLTVEIEGLEITHRELIKWIATQTDDQLEQVYEDAERRLTAWEIILGLCEHESHHRGQIVTYLRLLNVEDPRPWGF